jgi:hypothetical protein
MKTFKEFNSQNLHDVAISHGYEQTTSSAHSADYTHPVTKGKLTLFPHGWTHSGASFASRSANLNKSGVTAKSLDTHLKRAGMAG